MTSSQQEPEPVELEGDAARESQGRSPEDEGRSGDAPAEGSAAGAGDAAPAESEGQDPRIARLERELEEHKQRFIHERADFQNYKKRIARDHERLRDEITMGVLREFLPVLDDFDRALATEGADLESLRAGLELIAGAMHGVMRGHGVHEIDAEGNPFDHAIHDAMMQLHDPELPEGTVKEVAQKGYLLRGSVLRPAKVIVSTGGRRREAPAGESADSSVEGEGEEDRSPEGES